MNKEKPSSENPEMSEEKHKSLERNVWEVHGPMLRGLSPDAQKRAVNKFIQTEDANRLHQELVDEAKRGTKVIKEKPLAIMDASKWFEWDDVKYSEEKMLQFVGVFGVELALTWPNLSADEKTRESQLQTIKNLFESKLLRMYANLHPYPHPDELNRIRQTWLNERWEQILGNAKKLAGS